MLENSTDIEAARRIACEGFIFGYPLVLTDAVHAGGAQRPNVLEHQHELKDWEEQRKPDPDLHSIWSIARLDLSNGPVVVSLPSMRGHCFSVTLLDRWTDVFASIGAHSCGWRGDRGGDYMVVGPDWRGQCPDGLNAVRSPANHPLLVLRILARDADDLEAARALQRRTQIFSPIAKACADHPPAPTDPLGLLRDTIDQGGVERFFNRLADLASAHPPRRRRQPHLDALRTLGLRPGHPFDLSTLPSTAAKAVVSGAQDALAFIAFEADVNSKRDHGWRVLNAGLAEPEDLLGRAANARRNLHLSRHEQALHAAAESDAAGRPLIGSERYRIRFDRSGMPVENFWALTLIGADDESSTRSTHAYPACEHALANMGERPPREIRIQREELQPIERTGWLQAPAGRFRLLLSLYQPQAPILKGVYRLPPIERISESAPGLALRRARRVAQRNAPDESFPSTE